jgi:hypothetical protein
MAFESPSTYQRLPSGPVVMRVGKLLLPTRGNSVMAPAGVIRAIVFVSDSVNHTLPSGPGVSSDGKAFWLGMVKKVKAPAVVICPTWNVEVLSSTRNQRFPSGPAVIPRGMSPDGRKNSVNTPAVVMRPMFEC